MYDRRRKALKTALHGMSLLLWLVGTLVGLAGLYLLLKFRQSSVFFSPSSYMTLPFLITVATAAFLLVSGFVGSFVGSARESTCLQGLFVYLLFVVFCLACTASALAFHHSLQLDSELQPLGEVFRTYTGSSQDQNSRAVDGLQESMECCGLQNYSDWRATSWFIRSGSHMLPHSCCNRTFTSCNGTVLLPDHFYQMGCEVKLQIVFRLLLDSVMWMFAGVFLLLVILLVPVVLLMRKPLLSYQFLDQS
ncbi:tetraspanin 37 [Eucyclogobius newberryi]|uniref:tetraspanin 37 n=1 Tax=Eucyclogobius newberryi TaxID=166745 RepID=UPI003B5A1AE8